MQNIDTMGILRTSKAAEISCNSFAAQESQTNLTSIEGLFSLSFPSYDSGQGSEELPSLYFNFNCEENRETTMTCSSRKHPSVSHLQRVQENQKMEGLGSLENTFCNMNINQRKNSTNGSGSNLQLQDCSDSGSYSFDSREESSSCCIITDNHPMEDDDMKESCQHRHDDSHAFSNLLEQQGFYKDGDTILNYHIVLGNTDRTLQLINHVESYDMLNDLNNHGQSALHLAVLTNQPLIVRRLICAGASVDPQDLNGETPLHVACRLGHKETVRHFLTPVQYEEIAENNYQIPFQRLPRDMRIRDCEGHTCLHTAASFPHLDIVAMLLQAGADVNEGDSKSGRTVLHMAAEMNNESLLLLLLSRRDILINAKDYAGYTPADLAYGRSHFSILDHLSRYPSWEPLTVNDDSDLDSSEEIDD